MSKEISALYGNTPHVNLRMLLFFLLFILNFLKEITASRYQYQLYCYASYVNSHFLILQKNPISDKNI